MPEILKNIKAEDRLKKIRIVSENDDVMGGQPEADGMKENDNNAIFDLACSVMHALAEVAKVDQKAIPQILDALGDSRTAGASQRIVNEVNKLAKNAETAANLANDKANQAKQEAYNADQKALNAQNSANTANTKANQVPNPIANNFVVGSNVASYKLMTVDEVKALLNVPALTSSTGTRTDVAMTQKAVSDLLSGSSADYQKINTMLIQRGQNSRSNNQKILFPISFKKDNIVVIPVLLGEGIHADSIAIVSYDKTGFIAKGKTPTGGGWQDYAFNWVAIGEPS